MHRHFPINLILLLSLTTFFAPLIAAQNNCLGDPSQVGYCTPLTYVDATGSHADAPTTAQCQDRCQGVNEDAGDWGVDFAGEPAGHKHLILGGPCSFSVARGDDSSIAALSFDMDNQDILDVVDESINRFAAAHGGRVAAQGTMECAGQVIKWFVE